jgi:hypothetical protein
MTNYLGYFVTPSAAISAVIILAVALGLTLAIRGRLETASRRVVFFLAAVSFGGILQMTILREPPSGACLDCLSYWPRDRLLSGQLGLDTALNIALFVPLGLFATLLWKAPFRVTGVAAVVSLAIEITQPLLGSGANDLADIAANTLGAFLGAGLATTILLIRDTITTKHLDVSRLVKLAVAITVTISLAIGLSVGGANAIQASGAQQLNTMFAGTTLTDYTREEAAWAPKIAAFWKANRTPASDAYGDSQVALQRFTWTFYWTTRCVTARWDKDGFTTEFGSGNQCTDRLG